jgi:hypothetical protein
VTHRNRPEAAGAVRLEIAARLLTVAGRSLVDQWCSRHTNDLGLLPASWREKSEIIAVLRLVMDDGEVVEVDGSTLVEGDSGQVVLAGGGDADLPSSAPLTRPTTVRTAR